MDLNKEETNENESARSAGYWVCRNGKPVFVQDIGGREEEVDLETDNFPPEGIC